MGISPRSVRLKSFSKPGRLAPLSADEWLWDSHGNESGTAEVFAFVSLGDKGVFVFTGEFS